MYNIACVYLLYFSQITFFCEILPFLPKALPFSGNLTTNPTIKIRKHPKLLPFILHGRMDISVQGNPYIRMPQNFT